MSRCALVHLVEPAEHRTRVDEAGARRRVTARRQRRLELQAAVGPLGVVVPSELVEQGAQMRLVDDDGVSRHSLRSVRTTRSAIAFARGARTGVRSVSIPSPRPRATKSPP